MLIQKKLSELTTSGELTGSEFLEVTQSGGSFKSLLSAIKTFIIGDYTGTGSVVSTGTVTQGIWNSAIRLRTTTAASASNLVGNADNEELNILTALAGACSISPMIGTPLNGQYHAFRFKDDGTARVLTFHSKYRFGTTFVNPGTTTANKEIYYEFRYNSQASKWDCVLISNGF